MFQRKIPMIFVLFSMWVLMFLTACGQNQELEVTMSLDELEAKLKDKQAADGEEK